MYLADHLTSACTDRRSDKRRHRYSFTIVPNVEADHHSMVLMHDIVAMHDIAPAHVLETDEHADLFAGLQRRHVQPAILDEAIDGDTRFRNDAIGRQNAEL